jgi:HK97 family phage major capsid protein/HK97 family phage prohead protease
MLEQNRPVPGQLEERQAPDLNADGKKIRGVIPYGVESRDLGGFREIIEPGALNRANLDDLVVTVDHVGLPIGRYPTTLALEDRSDGLHWAVDPPASRQDVREAVERGDLKGGSWRMVVGKDEWRGDVRHVTEIKSLRDVAIVTTGAYPAEAAHVELRSQPDPAEGQEATMADQAETKQDTTETVENRSQPSDALNVETRVEKTETETRSFQEIVIDQIRGVNVGETRSLTSSGSPLSPSDFSVQLFQTLRPRSIALQSGVPVYNTDREKVFWPKLNTDGTAGLTAEGNAIGESDPGFTQISAEPVKLAAITQVSNELIDDSDPPIIQVLSNHISTVLALKLDNTFFNGGTAPGGGTVVGLATLGSTQAGGTVTLTGGVAGTASYSTLLGAVGLLRAANSPEPYVIAAGPQLLTGLESMRDTTGQSVQPPPGFPNVYTSTAIANTAGTTVAYMYSPSQLGLVVRQDATVEVDRSRLFNQDESEIRGKVRFNTIAPNPSAVVKLTVISS